MVEILEVCRVAPPAEFAPETRPLTFFDIRWLRLLHIQRLYFYDLPSPETDFRSTIVPRLRRSLSLALRNYLPLAGTLTWPADSRTPLLVCAAGDSVSLAVAETSAADDFDLLAEVNNAVADAAACHSLVPELSASAESSPVLAVQLTSFPGRGFSVGLTINHAALDGKSLVSFVKSWAAVSRSGEISPPPAAERRMASIDDPAGLGEAFADQWRAMGGPDNRSLLPLELSAPPDSLRGTFQLPPEKLEKLRRSVAEVENFRASTFALTCAYAWVCLAKAEDGAERRTVLDLPVDCRARLEPPLPEDYFGNCIGTARVVMEREILAGKSGLSAAAKAIGEAIRRASEGGRVLEGAENWVSFLAERVEGVRTYYVASSHRFGLYGVDFGWGGSRKVDVVSKRIAGVLSLADSRASEGGVEFGLVLKKLEMQAFAACFVQGLESL